MTNIVAIASSACFAMSLLRHVVAMSIEAWLREAKVSKSRMALNSNGREA
jgi:hypothetical protein